MTNQILAAGDWHGDTAWAQRTIRYASELGIKTLIQVGDFGIWPEPGGPKYVRKVNLECEKRDVDLIVVPGNHENYDRIDSFERDEDGWLVNPEWARIRFAPRGHVWKLPNNMWAAALGGGGSIDMNTREIHKSWWPQEEITRSDVNALKFNMQQFNLQSVDVMFTHEAPAGVFRPEKTGQTKPIWLTPDVENYCNRQRVLLREAVDLATPRALYHGHWHDWYEDILEGATAAGVDYRTRVFGLTMNGMPSGHAVSIEWSEPVPGLVETCKETV